MAETFVLMPLRQIEITRPELEALTGTTSAYESSTALARTRKLFTGANI